METDEISERYIAPCFVNGLEAYNGEVNLEFNENLISNEFTVKLSLDYEEDDSKLRVILGRSFLRLAHGVVDFGNRVITIYTESDPFVDDDEKTGKSSDDWDQLLDFNFDDVPKFGEELPRDNVKLDEKNVKEEEDAMKRIKGEALKEKDDPGAFIFPIRTAESDSDEEEEYTPGTHDGEAGSSRSKRPRQHETVEEVLLPQVHYEFLLWEGCSRNAKSRYNTRLTQLLPRHIYSPCIINWDVLNQMGCDGEIDDMLRIRLCYEFYSTYEFDEVCAGDELQSKKIIRFRLGGRAHNLTLLEFAQRLGLYQGTELEEEGFNVYFEREPNFEGDPQNDHLWFVLEDNWGAYNPPGYAQPQYDQYYQRYQIWCGEGVQVLNTVGNTGGNQPRVVRCYNCNGEGRIAKKCTARKGVKDFEWFKDKILLAQAQKAGVVLNEEQQNFLADSLEEINDCEDLQLPATTNFKADHVDAYDSDCDDNATTNAIFMANLSPVGSLNDDTVEPRYDSDIHYKVPYYDTYHDSDMLNSNIQEVGYIENIVSNNESYDELKGNIDVISYNYMLNIRNDEDKYVPPPVQKNDMMFSVIEQMKSQVEKCNMRRTTLSPHEIGSWEQSDIKSAFKKDVIPFSENLKETFKLFEMGFITEVKEMKDIFEQLEDEVDQCSVEKKCFEIEKK
nr:hypothetical protein [Tanacetum cinerariifolium]